MITQVQETRPLSDLLPQISSTLSTSCPAPDCVRRLAGLLRQLDHAEVGALLLELDLLGTPVGQKVTVAEALVRVGYDGEALSVWIAADEGEELVEKLLVDLATGKIAPTRSGFVTRCI